ncbi:MAG TPA: hypothetical protein VF041_00065 [Gemmatimonadaceae bacterium]
MRRRSLRTPATARCAAVVLALCFVTACDERSSSSSKPGSHRSVTRAALPDTASDPGAKVARRIVRAATLDEAVTGTREALTRSGIAITDFAGTTEPATGAPSPFVVLPTEAVVLAYEARGHASHSRLTLAELAEMLSDFGWAWDGEGTSSQQMMRVVAAWVRGAQRAPNDPLSFTPLFLADMGRRQVPAVDLASDSTDPRMVKLGFLEVHLIAGALTRGLGAPPARAAAPIPAAAGQPRLFWNASYGAVMDGGPCSDAKKWFGETLPGQLMSVYGGWGVGQGMEKALGAAGLSEANVGRVSKSLDAIGLAMKIVKLAELYASAQIDVQPASEMPAHRPSPGVEKTAAVVARAGIDPKDWEEYQKSLKSTQLAGSVRDCLETAGLPTWSDMADIAADAETWRVQWTLGEGSPKHALHQVAGNDWYVMGQRIMKLKRTSPTSAEARYTFKLTEEFAKDHQGEQYDGQVQVIASLRTAKAPSVSLLTDVALGGLMGLVKSLGEIGIGWFQTVVTPKSDIMVPITYHEEGVNLYIEDDNDVSFEVCMGKEGCPKSPMAVDFGGSERSHHVYAGNIRMGDDSLWHGQVILTVSGTYSLPDPHAGDAIAAAADKGDDIQQIGNALKGLALLANVPKCHGTYSGYQTFAVEGAFEHDYNGIPSKVGLRFIPVRHFEEYHTTPACPWEAGRVDGFATVPSRLVRDDRGMSITIDPPTPGGRRVYHKQVNAGSVRGSTTIIVGGSFQQ